MITHSKTSISENDIKEVSNVLREGIVNMSTTVEQLEEELTDYIGTKHGFAISSGTLALYVSLIAMGIRKNQEVIIPSYVCHNVLSAVEFCGARPILADINLKDFNIDFNDVTNKITRNTGAIIIPHTFGTPVIIDNFKSLNIPIIEDCCHSIGSTVKNVKVGIFGNVSVFSFHALKMMTTGLGGMILTDDEQLYAKFKSYQNPDYDKGEFMRYFPMSNIQAALGLSQLKQLDNFIDKRMKIVELYDRAFKSLDITLPFQDLKDRKSVAFRYCIMLNKRYHIDEVIDKFYSEGIVVRKPIPKPLHQFRPLKNQFCLNSQIAVEKTISLPIYPQLSEAEINKVIDTTHRILGG